MPTASAPWCYRVRQRRPRIRVRRPPRSRIFGRPWAFSLRRRRRYSAIGNEISSTASCGDGVDDDDYSFRTAPPPPLILSPRHYWNPSCDTSLRFLRCSSSLPSPPLVSSLQQYHPKFSCSSSSPQKQSRRADQRYPLRHRSRRRTSCTPPSMFLRRSNWLVDFGSSPTLSPTWCLSRRRAFSRSRPSCCETPPPPRATLWRTPLRRVFLASSSSDF
mmetsp:Transcript_3342/g.11897  ORF Transcript_3342/g.11897 Transcript_3342/m.11897 type:complete len:217 (+) Transcript_3342:4301-4951(+)